MSDSDISNSNSNKQMSIPPIQKKRKYSKKKNKDVVLDDDSGEEKDIDENDSKKMKLEETGEMNGSDSKNSNSKGHVGHRPVTSCTHCRQHKIKCNAYQVFPKSCSRCDKMGLHCEIDPDFRPKKGSQLQSLKNDINELKLKLEYLTRNEGLIATALNKTKQGEMLIKEINDVSIGSSSVMSTPQPEIPIVKEQQGREEEEEEEEEENISISINENDKLPSVLQKALENDKHIRLTVSSNQTQNINSSNSNNAMVTNAIPLLPMPHATVDEFVLGDVHISIQRADELHQIFVQKYLPVFPILETNSATELFTQSQILFWTVMLTASISDPKPTLYNQLASLIKQLAIETCWLRTPRSTHISQALLILCTWPLPNEKILDDCSYRFVGLAKSLSFQLGLHRGKFMSEFSRTQTSMPQAEKWRTRTWLGIFFQEQLWSSIHGLPSTSQTDYLIEQSLNNNNNNNDNQDNVFDLPKNFQKLIHLASFQLKMYNTMGSNVKSPDGLIKGKDRGKELSKLEKELEKLAHIGNDNNTQDDTTDGKDICVEVYHLYVKLMLCCFAFLPDTPEKDQKKYVYLAYRSSIRIITLVTKLLENQQLLELPIYVRHGCTYSAFILFKLYLSSLLDNKYVDSARQSVVTVHRLYRNQLTAWATSVENDVSRTASVLEKLNFVLITHPEIFIEQEQQGIISRMRSHLTGSLFYDLVWCVHEARRRELDPAYKKAQLVQSDSDKEDRISRFQGKNRKLLPLPLYNQITKEDFETTTKTTPGGTTVTTLIPTKSAIKKAKAEFAKTNNGRKLKNSFFAINGIPLKMLDQNGSIKFLDSSLSPNFLPKSNSEKKVPEISIHQPPPMQRSNTIVPTGSLIDKPTRKAESVSPRGNSNMLNIPVSPGPPLLPVHITSPTPPLFKGQRPLLPSASGSSINFLQKQQPQAQQPESSLFSMSNTFIPGMNVTNSRTFIGNANARVSDVRNSAESVEGKEILVSPSMITQGDIDQQHAPVINKAPSNLFSYSGNRSTTPLLGNNAAFTINDTQAQQQSLKKSLPQSTNNSSENVSTDGSPSIQSAQQIINDLDSFFQQQSAGWIEDTSATDDFLGLFDMNMAPEF